MNNNNIYNISFTYIPSLGGGIEKDSRDGMHMENPIEEYEKYLRGKYENEETVDNYLKFVKVFVKQMDWRMKRLTQNDIDEYVIWNRKNRLHNGNTSRFCTVQRFLNWYGRSDLQLPKQKMLPTNKSALTKEQMQHICQITRKMSWLHQLTFTLELISLRRPKDIRNLKMTDRHGDILRYVDKTSRATGIKREVLSQWVMEAWDNYITTERPMPRTKRDAEYLILTSCTKWYGCHLKSNNMIDRLIREIGRESGITPPNGENWTNYLIKRTGITQQAHICNNLKIVSTQAGHNSIETTAIYDRTQDNDTRKHLNNFESVINEKYTYNHIRNKPKGIINKITNDSEQIPRISYNQWDEEDNVSFSFSFFSFETFFMADVNGTVGAGGNISNPHNMRSFFVYEPPSDTYLTPSPTHPIDAYLDDCDTGRVDFETSHPFLVIFSPHHLHGLTLPDHVGGDLQQVFLSFSPPPPPSPYALLGCNKNVTRYTKKGDIGCNTILGLSYLRFTIVYTKV